jgi:tetratricopeptide (TPR) repeat protein
VNRQLGSNPLEGGRYLALIDRAKNGHVDEVLQTLDDFLAANKHLDEDSELRGRILWNKALFASIAQRWNQAIEFYRSAGPFIRERSIFLSNQAGLAKALAATGDFGSALQVLDDALAISAEEPYNILGLLWNYARIAEQIGSTVPERYRELLLETCRIHGVQLPAEMEASLSFNDAILTAHRLVRDSQERR